MRRWGVLLVLVALVASTCLLARPAWADTGEESLRRNLNSSNEALQLSTSSAGGFQLGIQSTIQNGTSTGRVQYLNDQNSKTYVNSGLTLSGGCVYIVTGNVTFQGDTSGPGAKVSGNAIIYIDPSATLTIKGGNANDKSAGYPGLELADGNTVQFIGTGKLVIKGGDGGRGGNGRDGGPCSGKWGGSGGSGGGGGGAGIGIKGANGGSGGSGGEGDSHEGSNGDGGNGGNGGSVSDCAGTVYVSTSMSSYSASRGSDNNETASGGNSSNASSKDGGGGGGGGGGQGGDAIGQGGAGGGGGGGGGAGDHWKVNVKRIGKGGGGGGGWSSGNGGTRGKNHDDSCNPGGSGGSAGSQSGSKNRGVYRSVTSDPQYTVTFDKNIAHPENNNTYKRQMDAADQSGETSRTVTFGETTVTRLTSLPTRKGFIFEGYYTSADNSGFKMFDAKGNPVFTGDKNLVNQKFCDSNRRWTAGNVALGSVNTGTTYNFQTKLYAHWKADKSEVLFDATGGASSMVKEKTYLDSKLSNDNPNVPTKPGYNFTGFYTERTGGTKVYDANMAYVMKDGAATATNFMDYCDGKKAYYYNGNGGWTTKDASRLVYYAQWSPVTYYIRYMSWDEATQDDAVVPIYGSNGQLTEYTVNNSHEYSLEKHTFGDYRLASDTELNLTREHYNFKGWNIYASQDWRMYDANYKYKGGLGTTQDQIVTLYAAWEAVGQVDITYDGQGGQGVPSRDRAWIGENESYLIAPEVPTKEGYTFLGWNTSADGSDPAGWYYYDENQASDANKDKVLTATKVAGTDAGWSQYDKYLTNSETGGKFAKLKAKVTPITDNLVFFAIWAKDPVLAYNPNGGIGHIESESKKSGSTINLAFDAESIPTWEGHAFIGWYDPNIKDGLGSESNPYTSKNTTSITMPDYNLTLKAKWEVEQETITASLDTETNDAYTLEHANDIKVGVWDATNGVIDDAKLIGSDKNAANAYKVDYGTTFEFAVYLPKQYDAGSMVVSSNDSVLVRRSKKDVTDGDVVQGTYYVYRIGSPRSDQEISIDGISVKQWRVVLVANDGEFGVTESTVTHYEDSDGNVVPAGTPGATPVTQTVGTSKEVTSYVYGSTVTLPTEEDGGITRTGYKFGGWYTDEELQNRANTPEITSTDTGKKVFYAKWEPVTYHIRYNTTSAHPFKNGTTGGVITGDAQTYGTSVTLTSVTDDALYGLEASKIGAGERGNFIGWTESEDSRVVTFIDGQSTSSLRPAKGNDQTYYVDLYALWEPDNVSVSFDTDGGAAVNPIVVDRNSNVELPETTKDGFTFKGWKNGDELVASPYTANEDVILKASWEAGTYTVKYDPNGGSGNVTTDDRTWTIGAEQDLKTVSALGFTGPAEQDAWTQAENFPTGKANTPTGAEGECVEYEVVDSNDTNHSKPGVASHYARVISGPAVAKYVEEGGVWKSNDSYPSDAADESKYWTQKDTQEITVGEGTVQNEYAYPLETQYEYTKEPIPANDKFLGWATSASGDVVYTDAQSVKDIATSGATVTLYAKWAAEEKCYVTYDANDGKWGEDGAPVATEIPAAGATANALVTSGPTKTGYTFESWATAKSGETTVEDTSSFQSASPMSNVTVYAKWTPITYTVTFHGEDGEGNAETTRQQTLTYDQQAQLNQFSKTADFWTNFPVPDGVGGLRGWSTLPSTEKVNMPGQTDASGNDIRTVAYTDGQTVLNLKSEAGNIDLYPIWITAKRTLTYDTNGGTNVPPQIENSGSSVSVRGIAGAEGTPVRSGYKFLGWHTEAQTTPVTDEQAAPSVAYPVNMSEEAAKVTLNHDQTLYAWWQKTTQGFVTYKVNDGSNDEFDLDASIYSKGDPVNVSFDANVTKRMGYTFAGWNSQADGSGVAYKSDGTTPTSTTYEKNLTFYAQWTPITFKLQFDLSDADVKLDPEQTQPVTQTVGYGTEVTLDTFGTEATSAHKFKAGTTPAGKHFAGWALQNGAKVADFENGATSSDVSTLTNVDGDTVVLYAVWADNTATLLLNKGLGNEETFEQIEGIKDGQGYPELSQQPERAGWDFKGYFTQPGGKGTKIYDEMLSCLSPDALPVPADGVNVTLYAHWAKSLYTVSYRNTDGTLLKVDDTAQVGTDYTLFGAESFSELKEEEGEALYWVVGTPANASVAEYRLLRGSTVSASDWPDAVNDPVSGSNINVFAFIQGTNSYQVRYDNNGGSWETGGIPQAEKVKEGDAYYVQFDKVPNRTGYDFVGWSKTDEKTGTNFLMYTEERYTELYGSLEDGETTPIEVVDPSKQEGAYKVGTVINADTTLYAIWEPCKYTITYKGNGGTTPEGKDTFTQTDTAEEAIKYAYSDKVKLENDQVFTQKDKKFLGWGTNDTVLRYKAGEVLSRLTEDENIDLYAIWTTAEGTAVDKSMHNIEITVNDTYVYDGKTHFEPHPTVKDTEDEKDGVPTVTTLKEGWDYELAWVNNFDAGTATVRVQGKGDYRNGYWEQTYIIKPALITAVTADNQTYNGQERTPKPTVKWGNVTLKEGTDYTIVGYENNVNAGTATVKISGVFQNNADGTGNFSSEKVSSATFKINPANAATAFTIATPANVTYTGAAFTPKPQVKFGTTELKEGADFTYSWKNNVNAGTATVTATGKGNFTGTKSVNFKINPIDSASAAAGKLFGIAAVPDQVYTGKAFTPAPKVTYNGKTLKAGTDFTYSYKNNVNVGTATVTANFKGNYKGSKSVTFKITAASNVSVSAPADQTYTGKAIQAKPTVKYNGATLREGTDFTLSWKDNVNVGTATVTATFKGNYAGSRSATFKIKAASAAANSGQAKSFSVSSPAAQTYDGKAKTPKPTVKFDGKTLREGTDYTLSWKDNVNVGTATVTATFRGNYAGSRSATFEIKAASATSPDVAKKFSIDAPADQTYTGHALTPKPTVGFAGRVLREGVDYALSYANNVAVGTATVTANFKGNYSGSRSATFGIGDVVAMHRLYNPYTGEHFYTANESERDTLVAAGWSYEGIGWYAPRSSSAPVYRLFNPYSGDHHYTTSAGERDSLLAAGWVDEGIGWYSDDARGVALFRQYNPYASVGSHNYTSSEGERDTLVSVGWQDEGTGWYGVKVD